MIIVYASVCGDILHYGHLIHLKNSKALGDKLVVGVLTDAAIMEKKKRPVISFPERMALVREIGCVDLVIPQETYTSYDNIKGLKPDIWVESSCHS